MRATATAIVTAALLAWAGCGNKAESASNSEYLLGLLHESWVNARAGLQKDPPDLGPLRGIRVMLGRTPRRVDNDYGGANKQEVLAKLKALRDAYESRVVPMLDLRSQAVRLAPGADIGKLKATFSELDKQYTEIEGLLDKE